MQLWDDKGRQDLDAVTGVWCSNIGLGLNNHLTLDISARLAGKLASLAPGGPNAGLHHAAVVLND
jgi:adenosylmethionine-8-amino-7-oxononanoate aminotransferase